MNPILNQISQPNSVPALGQVKQLMNVVNASNNPVGALQAMLADNPIYKQLFPLIQKNGGDYQKTFYDLAKQKGVNPEEVLNVLKNAH